MQLSEYSKKIGSATARLSVILEQPSVRERFPRLQLLSISSMSAEVCADLPPTLLPFMLEQQPQSWDVYAFDVSDPMRERTVVWNDHAVVGEWLTFDEFLKWIMVV